MVGGNAAAELVPDLLTCVLMSYGRVMRFAGLSTEPFERVFVRALNGVAASAWVFRLIVTARFGNVTTQFGAT